MHERSEKWIAVLIIEEKLREFDQHRRGEQLGVSEKAGDEDRECHK